MAAAKKFIWIAVILVVLALAATAAWKWKQRNGEGIKFTTPYQAILLDDNQVYYGRIQSTGADFMVLTDVYYVKTAVDPKTKEVTNVLVRRGKEWHAPTEMVINSHHIVLIEPVSPNSKLAQLIEEEETKAAR